MYVYATGADGTTNPTETRHTEPSQQPVAKHCLGCPATALDFQPLPWCQLGRLLKGASANTAYCQHYFQPTLPFEAILMPMSRQAQPSSAAADGANPPAQADAEAAVDEPPSEEVAPLFIDLHSVAT